MEKMAVTKSKFLSKAAVDRLLLKTSLDITRLVCEEHREQLHESKSTLMQKESTLKSKLNNDDSWTKIIQDIFEKTESKKNTILHKQNKKFEALKKTSEAITDKPTSRSVKSANIAVNENSNRKHLELRRKQQKKNGKPKTSHKSAQNGSFANEKSSEKLLPIEQQKKTSTGSEINNQPKNVNTPGSAMKHTYATATKLGVAQRGMVKTPATMAHQPENIKDTISLLITCLQSLQKGTEGSSEYETAGNGDKKKRYRGKYRGAKRQY